MYLLQPEQDALLVELVLAWKDPVLLALFSWLLAHGALQIAALVRFHDFMNW